MSKLEYSIRPAKPKDVNAILDLIQPLVDRRILLGKEKVTLYESVPEFMVVEHNAQLLACGALHVMWEDLAEIRTLAVRKDLIGLGIGKALVQALLERARSYELGRVFCLTFETEFFSAMGFKQLDSKAVDEEVYLELLRSHDDGVAEFLDLARVKPNTLGNTRMIKYL